MTNRLAHALASLSNRRALLSSVALVAVGLAGSVACGGAPTDEGVGSSSAALSACGAACTPIDPPAKPATPQVVTISSGDLQNMIQLVLAGSVLSVDTTQSANPPEFGPPVTVTNPARAECFTDGDARCNLEIQEARLLCLKEVTARCTPIPATITTNAEYWTYFHFSPLAAQYGAKDVLYSLETIHHTGVFTFDVDIDWIHTTFTEDNVTAGFSAGATPGGPPSIWLGLTDFTSLSPTLLVRSDFPNVDLTNMQASVTLSGVAPTADGQSVDFASEASTFTCDWSTVDFPTDFASIFYDVEGKVASLTEARVNAAFEAAETHTALSAALRALIQSEVKKTSPAGYASIVSVAYADPASWQIYYWPN